MAALNPLNRPKLTVKVDSVRELREALRVLVQDEVLVGFPEDTSQRDDELPDSPITNAALGYIHDTGMPEQNIPARPFMRPGIEQAADKLVAALVGVARSQLNRGSREDVKRRMHRVGLVAQAALRAKINEGIPPPLAASTLRDRARRGRKGAKQELANRALGMPASTSLAKPLIDTGQLRNAINYVIRNRRLRR